MATDDFNRANEDPLSGGGAWGAFGTVNPLAIVSNQVVGSAGSECASRYLTTFGPDTQMSVRYTASVGNAVVAMWLGVQDGHLDTFDGYRMSLTDSEGRALGIAVYTNGVGIDGVSTDTFPLIVTGDTISFSRLGDVVSAAINGTTYLTWENSTHTAAGQVAIGTGGLSDALDDFSVSSIPTMQMIPTFFPTHFNG